MSQSNEVDDDQFDEDGVLRILEITRKLAENFELDELVADIFETARVALQADSGSVWLFNEDSGQLEMYLPIMAPRVAVEVGKGLVGECFSTEEIINVPDCYVDPRFNPDVDKSTGYVTRTLISVPLKGLRGRMVGVLQLLNREGGPFNKRDERLAQVLAAQSATALQRAQWLQSALVQERINEEMALARDMQMSSMPTAMPQLPGYDFAGGFVPAEHVGGDMFDISRIGDAVLLLLGDATGHGFGAALSSTRMHAMLTAAFRVGAGLDAALIAVNNQLSEDLPDNRFLTAFIGFLDPVTHCVRYHAPGQGPLMVFRAASDKFEWLPPTSFPVGVMGYDEIDPASEIALAPGDILAIISDGLYECEDAGGEQFGQERVQDIVKARHEGDMEQLRIALMDAVAAHRDGLAPADDITVVLVRRES